MPWASRPSDQRRFPRFKSDVSAIATVLGDREIMSFRARCDNISEGGLSAHGLSPLALGDRVTLELQLPVSTHPIRVETMVVRRGVDRCGLEFLSLSDYHRNLVKRYCHIQPKEKPRRWL